MINGLFLSAQGAQAQQIRLGVVSNNLANSTTTGFKRDMAVFQSHQPFDLIEGDPEDTPPELQDAWGGVTIAEIDTDFTQNAIQPTEGTLDVALAGPGFIKVANRNGQFLTRAGAFTLGTEGTLLTSGGDEVLDVSGVPLQVDPDAGAVVISPDGTVGQDTDQGLNPVGQIALVQPKSLDNLEKIGLNLYKNHGAESPAGPELSLVQGHLETSGVNPVTEMVQLIETSRAFEANINMIKYQDEALGQLLSTVPRL